MPFYSHNVLESQPVRVSNRRRVILIGQANLHQLDPASPPSVGAFNWRLTGYRYDYCCGRSVHAHLAR